MKEHSRYTFYPSKAECAFADIVGERRCRFAEEAGITNYGKSNPNRPPEQVSSDGALAELLFHRLYRRPFLHMLTDGPNDDPGHDLVINGLRVQVKCVGGYKEPWLVVHERGRSWPPEDYSDILVLCRRDSYAAIDIVGSLHSTLFTKHCEDPGWVREPDAWIVRPEHLICAFEHLGPTPFMTETYWRALEF